MINNILIALRKSKHMTQADVAEYLNIPRTTYNSYEKRDTVPPIDLLYKLADLYNISLDTLLGRNYKSSFSNEELELLSKFNKLNTNQKHQLIGYLDALINKN